jgi:hypothetical protein
LEIKRSAKTGKPFFCRASMLFPCTLLTDCMQTCSKQTLS